MSLFNFCIITTSTEERAKIYRQLIQRRKEHGIYPAEIEFIVYSDPKEIKIGSGGATLRALDKWSRECTEKYGIKYPFRSNKMLMIHAGGSDNVLLPYSPEGILFAPVPVESSSTLSPIMLDLQLHFFLKYPWKQGEIVISPGDVFIDSDSSLLTQNRGDVHGYSVMAPFKTGSSHGVFQFDAYMHSVTDFFQKAEESFLREHAAIEGTDCCAIDTGIVSISQSFAEAFLAFGNITLNGQCIKDCLESGSIAFNIYLELFTAALKGMNYENYCKKVSSISKAPTDFLKLLFDTFSGFDITATLIRNSSFHHPETLKKYLDLCKYLQQKSIDLWYVQGYAELQIQQKASWIVYNSYKTNTPLRKGKPIVIEAAQTSTFENPLGNNFFTGVVGWETESTIPEGICIDRRVVDKDDIYCIYSITDTFYCTGDTNDIIFCGIPLNEWLSQRGLSLADIGCTEECRLLCNAKLFCSNVPISFLSGYWQKPIGMQWTETFRKCKRFSFNECSHVTYAVTRDRERETIRAAQLRTQILHGRGWIGASSRDFSHSLLKKDISVLDDIYETTGDVLIKAYRNRLLGGLKGADASSTAVGFLQHDISEELFDSRIALDNDQSVVVRCPVRIDIAGGWTDTPPFTLRYGGAVVNFAADVYGAEPIQVFCKRSKELAIRISSIDRGIHYSVDTFTGLTSLSNEFDLVIALLRVLGFSEGKFSTLKDLLKSIGGGIELTMFCGVPKGAGLGTSSLLAASLLTALYTLFGRTCTAEKRLDTIIKIEQLLGMGSGWQDLLGGIHGGIKLIQSKPGLIPDPWIQSLNSDMLTNDKILNRFTLVNTGIQRTSVSPGREVAGLMNENIPSYNFTLNYLKTCAVTAADAISMGNFERLSQVINECRRANNRINAASLNPQIDSLLEVLQPYYSAAKLTGAGGGGFALFLSESDESAVNLRNVISKQGCSGASVVEFSLNKTGIRVDVNQV